MRQIVAFISICICLLFVSSAQSWTIYNSADEAITAHEAAADPHAPYLTDAEFGAYTTGLGSFVFYSTAAAGTYANVTTDIKISGMVSSGPYATASGTYSAALGGYSSVASNIYASALGGLKPKASGQYSAVVGGYINSATGNYAAVLGGRQSVSSGQYSASAGGWVANSTGDYSFASGKSVTASGIGAAAIGQYNTAGGFSSFAFGTDSVTSGDYSFVLGRRGSLSTAADRTFADIYGTGAISIVSPDVHVIYGQAGFEKKVGIQTLTPHSRLDVNGSVAFAFNHYSSGNSPVALTVNHMSINCDASSGDVTFNLMSSVNVIGRGYEITITDDGSGTNKCFIDPVGSETLNGYTNYSGLDTIGESVLIRATSGSTWDWTIKGGF